MLLKHIIQNLFGIYKESQRPVEQPWFFPSFDTEPLKQRSLTSASQHLLESLAKYPAYQAFTSQFVTVAKLQLGSSN